MQNIGDWVNWDRTYDQYLAGNPETEVEGIAVSWMPTFENLKKALRMKCNLFVTHEPLYAFDINEKGYVVDSASSQMTEHLKSYSPFTPSDVWVRKKKWLNETGLVVYRCHDFWDDYPDIGIYGA